MVTAAHGTGVFGVAPWPLVGCLNFALSGKALGVGHRRVNDSSTAIFLPSGFVACEGSLEPCVCNLKGTLVMAVLDGQGSVVWWALGLLPRWSLVAFELLMPFPCVYCGRIQLSWGSCWLLVANRSPLQCLQCPQRFLWKVWGPLLQ